MTLALPAVAGLLGSGGPPAIFGRIAPVIVDAVEAVSRRGPPAHVGEKGLIAGAPAITYGDAAPAVRSVMLAIGVFAAINGVRPSPIFRSAVAFPVGGKPHAAKPVALATAR